MRIFKPRVEVKLATMPDLQRVDAATARVVCQHLAARARAKTEGTMAALILSYRYGFPASAPRQV